MELVYANTMEQADALTAVIAERSYQDAKWGTVDERPKEVGSWLTLMRKLLRDAEDNWATSDNDQGALAELRKVVAVGLACFEQHGVPERDVDSAVVAPAPTWPPAKDERLAGLSNNKLHEMYEALRGKPYDETREATDADGVVHTLTSQQIDTELEARGDCPIPF